MGEEVIGAHASMSMFVNAADYWEFRSRMSEEHSAELRQEISDLKEERDRFQRLLYLEAEDHDRAREKTKAAEQSLVETRVELGEAMLVLEQQDRRLAASADLLATLDPDTLNPEQFNAWCALSEAVGNGEQK